MISWTLTEELVSDGGPIGKPEIVKSKRRPAENEFLVLVWSKSKHVSHFNWEKIEMAEDTLFHWKSKHFTLCLRHCQFERGTVAASAAVYLFENRKRGRHWHRSDVARCIKAHIVATEWTMGNTLALDACQWQSVHELFYSYNWFVATVHQNGGVEGQFQFWPFSPLFSIYKGSVRLG